LERVKLAAIFVHSPLKLSEAASAALLHLINR